MDTAEKYLVVALTLLFIAGVCLLIAAVREQKKMSERWDRRG